MTERRADGKTTIAEALRASLSAEAESRSVEIAIRHFGFDGKGGATFSAIGKELGITREWVRQLVRRTTESVSKTPQIPALEKALRILEDRAPARCSSLASELFLRKKIRRRRRSGVS
jgi:DNA-directed RNA polymerase sigma subunit (sigma70/sigma32)